MTWLMAVLLKGIIGFAFLSLVFVIAAVVYRIMPDSKIKRILFSPLPGHRKR